ncbi:MAG: beta-galactosidase, partial [Ignavibacteriae bacterium]|nr:beta-galactosidase [Ignavibacteriota bacterium]
ISHEIGQWCVYPNFKEIKKYTGVLKPKNFEIFKESLEANHMGDLADNFLMASGKLQALCYKAEIEAALRTKGFGGFQLLDLHDFPGQGTALVGVLDPFWEEKGYITSSEFSRFCNSVVPLVRLEKRIFKEGETLIADVEVANFNAEELKSVVPKWKLSTIDGKIESSGSLPKTDISIGNGIDLGKINYEIPNTGVPRKLILEVSVSDYTNSWDIWVYPEIENILINSDILITETIDSKTIAALENGKNVLLSLGKGKVKDGKGGEVGVGFSSIFWNTAWTKGQKPHTLGILCDPKHEALKLFPTEYHSNWQWWDAMSHADVIKLNEFPVQIKPIVRVIDDWFKNRRLALLFEVKVGKGKLLVSGIDLHTNLDSRYEAKQLLKSLNNYMNSEAFDPEFALTISEINNIVK